MPRVLESEMPLMTGGGMKRVSWIITVIIVIIIVIDVIIIVTIVAIPIIVTIIAVELGGGRWTAP